MKIKIEIKKKGIFAYATVSIDGVEMLTRPFASVEDAEKWMADIESMAKECECPKCRAYREAQTAKPEEFPTDLEEIFQTTYWLNIAPSPSLRG